MVLLWSDRTLSDARVEKLKRAFPSLQVMMRPIEELEREHPSICEEVDIVHAGGVSIKELECFAHVKWMHCPFTDLKGFSPLLLRKQRDILLTRLVTKPSIHYLDFATTLLFACCQGVPFRAEAPVESVKPFSRMLLVQIGLGTCGTALAGRAKEAHMRVIGVAAVPSFHPFCDKVLRHEQLHSVLPAADIVIVTNGLSGEKNVRIGQEELALMKPNSSLFVLGEGHDLDSAALFAALNRAALGAVWLDFTWPEDAPEWQWDWEQFPKVFHTLSLIDSLGIAPEADFHFFLWNLDCFYHQRYLEMDGLWDRAPARLLERRKTRNL